MKRWSPFKMAATATRAPMAFVSAWLKSGLANLRIAAMGENRIGMVRTVPIRLTPNGARC